MTITLGRFNIPIILIAGIISYIIIFIILKIIISDKQERKTILEIISNTLLIGFFTWKISPIFTSFTIDNPLSFIKLPGGSLGSLLALLTTLTYILYKSFKSKIKKVLIIGITFLTITILTNTIFNLFNTTNLTQEKVVEIEQLGFELSNNKPTIINFWASWCGPCVAEIPELNHFYSENSQNINFYGVNLSSTEKGSIEEFLVDNNMHFPIVYDVNSTISNYFEVKTIPTTIIIKNEDGKFKIIKHSGAVTNSLLKSSLN